MNRTQFAAAALMGAILAGLAACGGDSNPPATTTAPNPAPASTMMMADALRAQADKLLADLAQYIKDNKWDLADKSVAELDGMKAKLPAEYGPRIDQLKQTLATAKSAMGKMGASMPTSMPTSMPAMGGMPKMP
ncbi:MAG TPA: hypothetical protein VHM90_04515 [Phycisphaerae bacterium]|jgi:hypothetical protein|nr:hypothetical protein [Phycisphaerae bacterium]